MNEINKKDIDSRRLAVPKEKNNSLGIFTGYTSINDKETLLEEIRKHKERMKKRNRNIFYFILLISVFSLITFLVYLF